MSEAPLPKKMKQTDIRTSLSCQRMNKVPKEEVEERPAKDQRQKAEEKTFKFRLNSETYSVACDASMTVLDALNTSQIFKKEKEKFTNRDKAVLIQISREMPRAAVKTDFPCCLIDDDEIIDVTFIKNDEDASNQRNITEKGQHSSRSNPKMFVTFCVAKKGGEKVNVLLKSEALRGRVEYVCVYAHKEETLKRALKRDGRFKKIIFKKHCALSEIGTESKHEMSHPVKHLNQKVFKVVVISNAILPESLEEWTSQVDPEPDIVSDAEVADGVDINQNPVNNKHKTKQDKNQGKSTGSSDKRPAPKVIPNTEEISKILRDQFKGLQEKLKERENLKNKSQVQNFYREEFDKSVEDFLEVKKVKRLTNLSNSVCQIRSDGSARGTGFLLFNRFVLTNAHVIGFPKMFDPAEFTAVFGYEDLDQNGTKHVQIKHLKFSFHGKDDKGNHLDYALLELNSADEISGCPELLHNYRNNSPNNKSQICIVGHPNGGVKKMDPCFVIGRENRQEAEHKHVSENVEFYHVISQQSLKEKWQFHENQIAYDSCFFHGSSGSPVFDADCKLIAIHTGGYVYPGEGKKTRSVMEYAYAMQPILDDIKAKARLQGNKEILDILEGNSNGSDESSNEEQPNQTDTPMEI
nr:serine protease FAM111A-like [Misgurnus anguillicaudatus]